MSEENFQEKNSEKITIKKSTYNNLLKGVIAAIAVATFFGGYSIGTLDDSNSSVTQEDTLAKEFLHLVETGACDDDVEATATPWALAQSSALSEGADRAAHAVEGEAR